jgi:hypothetical protein
MGQGQVDDELLAEVLHFTGTDAHVGRAQVRKDLRVLSAAVCSPILPWKTRPGHRPPQLREAASAAAVA